MTEDKVLYTARVHTLGNRNGGASRSSDGRLDVKFSTPGGTGNGTLQFQFEGVSVGV